MICAVSAHVLDKMHYLGTPPLFFNFVLLKTKIYLFKLCSSSSVQLCFAWMSAMVGWLWWQSQPGRKPAQHSERLYGITRIIKKQTSDIQSVQKYNKSNYSLFLKLTTKYCLIIKVPSISIKNVIKFVLHLRSQLVLLLWSLTILFVVSGFPTH